MKGLKKFLVLLLVLVMGLSIISCKNEDSETVDLDNSEITYDGAYENGATEFTFKVTDIDGNSKYFLIKTNKTTVGDALLEVGLIQGEESAYGLYVKTVNGVTLDYDKDQKYWAFYINGEYASTGVDLTEVEEFFEYEFKAE